MKLRNILRQLWMVLEIHQPLSLLLAQMDFIVQRQWEQLMAWFLANQVHTRITIQQPLLKGHKARHNALYAQQAWCVHQAQKLLQEQTTKEVSIRLTILDMLRSTIVQVELTHQREIQRDLHQSVQRAPLEVTARMGLLHLWRVQWMHIAQREVQSSLTVQWTLWTLILEAALSVHAQHAPQIICVLVVPTQFSAPLAHPALGLPTTLETILDQWYASLWKLVNTQINLPKIFKHVQTANIAANMQRLVLIAQKVLSVLVETSLSAQQENIAHQAQFSIKHAQQVWSAIKLDKIVSFSVHPANTARLLLVPPPQSHLHQ